MTPLTTMGVTSELTAPAPPRPPGTAVTGASLCREYTQARARFATFFVSICVSSE